MNILYVPSWFPGRKKPSNGIYFYEQAKMLSKIADNLFIIYPREIEFRQVIYKDENNIHFFPFPKFHYKKTYFFQFFLNLFIKKIIKKYGEIDFIHAQSFLWAGVECSKISKKYKIPLVITEHHSRFLVGKEKLKTINILQRACYIASKIVFVSSALKEQFSKNILTKTILNKNKLYDFSLLSSKLAVIPNPVADYFFLSMIDKNTNENKVTKNIKDEKAIEINRYNDNLPIKNLLFKIKEKFIFVTIANLKESKGFDFLIDSFYAAFSNEDVKDKVFLLIGGEGPYRNKIEKKIKDLNLTNNIILLGQLSREEVEYILEISDCFISASKYETFGISLAEALAKGLPVLTTDCMGPKDFIDADCGIIIKDRNIEEFKEALIKIFNRNLIFNKEKIRQLAFSKLSETAFLKNYSNLYREIIQDSN